MKTAQARSEPEDALDLGDMLTRLVGELEAAANSCAALQWSISALLEKVHHPDLGAEIHMLQDIDRLQQTLVDIAAIVAVTAGSSRNIPLSHEDVGQAIRLESLRHRLGLSIALPGEPEDEGDEITWL